MHLIRRVDNLDPWEATKGLTLIYDGECPADDCLASDHSSQYGHNKHRPSHTLYRLKIVSDIQKDGKTDRRKKMFLHWFM